MYLRGSSAFGLRSTISTDTIRHTIITEFPAGSPGLEPREECAIDSYDLKAEQSALARLKQVSGNAGSIVQYKPANRQDEAVLRRNRRIELMKPVPVERLRFKCSCGAGDARADKASKTLPVTGKPALCQEPRAFKRGLFSSLKWSATTPMISAVNFSSTPSGKTSFPAKGYVFFRFFTGETHL